jgi:glycosyltransferase involved in cell wall biosynthesis
VAFWLTLPLTLYRLHCLIRERRIDLINIHYPLASFVYFGIYRFLLGTPLVISAHGTDLMHIGESSPSHPWAIRWLLRGCSHLTAPSRHYLAGILTLFPSLRQRSTPIHNGVDLAEFQDEAGQDAPAAGAILCIAAHNVQKGIDTLLQAMVSVRSHGLDLRLVLVGDGPLRPDFEEQARRLGIDSIVEFAGFQDLPTVRRQLHQCSLFVLPSRVEPFGIVILEAMAQGKVIVATRVGGIPEIIEHLENGYLVPPDNPRLLAEAISEVIGDPALQRRLGAAGEVTVRERFTYQHTGSNFELLFSDLVRRRGQG